MVAALAQHARTTADLCRRLELPTWLVAVAIHASWFGLTSQWRHLPGWAVTALGAWTVAWHMSFQHEAIHGHPTRSAWLNTALAWAPLSLWLPYPLYRESHLAHHRAQRLTDPREDPESFYVTPEAWAGCGVWTRRILRASSTLAGRLALGPLLLWARFFTLEVRQLRTGDRGRRGVWLGHGVSAGLVLLWVVEVCEISLADYLLLVVYPGTSLVLLRSFFEHRPATEPGQASAITEAGPLARLLFLDNNFHAVHHAAPGLPWFELAARYRAQRTAVLAANGGFLHRGYGALLLRYGLSPKDDPVHPGPQPVRPGPQGEIR